MVYGWCLKKMTLPTVRHNMYMCNERAQIQPKNKRNMEQTNDDGFEHSVLNTD